MIFSAVLFAIGYWQVALSWLGGIFIIFPFMASLRQLLEHRSELADSFTDYNSTDPPKISRMFGIGIIASTMGGAGFNRHLLHHWDPQVSYTRLKEVEYFLRDTPINEIMTLSKSTYIKTFFKLFNK